MINGCWRKLLIKDAASKGSSLILRSRMKGNFQVRFWRPVRRGNPPTEFSDFYYASDGSHIEVPKYLRKSEEKLKKLQRRFAKAEKRTKKWYKILKSLQKAHYKVRCQIATRSHSRGLLYLSVKMLKI